MSTDVSEAAVEEVSGALARNFASFSSQQWVDTATALVKAGGDEAAAQLAPGETVEWLTPGIVHRNGKVWPNAILVVTPHRLIVSAVRGSIRTKREVSSLYRGPESLMNVSHRLLPGSSADHWMLEIATQQGPFLFAIPNFVGSESLAQITGAFIARRAQYLPESGITLDGAPWGTYVPAQRTAPSEEYDPFVAARADLGEAAEEPTTDDPGPATEAFDPLDVFTPAPEPSPEVLVAEPVVAAEPVAESADVLPAADWYADPLGEAGLRYWDGQGWTHHTAN